MGTSRIQLRMRLARIRSTIPTTTEAGAKRRRESVAHFTKIAAPAQRDATVDAVSEARTVAIGQQAQAFTQQLLSTRPFSVYTKWQSVYNSGRHYAFILFPDGEDLSAKLIREGLARIHTSGTTLPDGRTTSQYENQLRQLESEARAAGRGGWRAVH